MKTFKGKAIYNPAGKAAEYAEWACNFYTGCSNDCHYYYCKRGVLAHTWSNTPKLKKCFKDESHALEVFENELRANLPELQKHGLFFSFTTDPMLCDNKDIESYKGRYDFSYFGGTINATWVATTLCIDNSIPVKILTKSTNWVDRLLSYPFELRGKELIAFGFTLTGHDELEPNASTNAERIEAMRKLHDAGFKTWASIEPVIDLKSSAMMIEQTAGFCDLYKIGLMSGKKYDKKKLVEFMEWCNTAYSVTNGFYMKKIYFKDSLLAQAGINREKLPENFVGRDYNMFND